MADSEIRLQIEQLRQTIRTHQYHYYALADPLVSDQEFDTLFRKLQALEDAHPEFMDDDSPTQRVGGQVADRFEKTRHPAPMLSLANAFTEEDLRALPDPAAVDWSKVPPETRDWYSRIKSRPAFRTLLNDRVVAMQPARGYADLDF